MPARLSHTVQPNSNITDAIMGGSHMTNLMGLGSKALQAIYVLVTLTSMIALIVNITKLAMSSGNPMGRGQALRNILISGICLAVLGSMGLVYAVFVSLSVGN